VPVPPRTGLVDADLHGPDVPRKLGLRRRQDSRQLTVFSVSGTAAARLQAVGRHGLQLASAAFLRGEGQGRPVMLTRAVPGQVAAFELLASRMRELLDQPGLASGADSD